MARHGVISHISNREHIFASCLLFRPRCLFLLNFPLFIDKRIYEFVTHRSEAFFFYPLLLLHAAQNGVLLVFALFNLHFFFLALFSFGCFYSCAVHLDFYASFAVSGLVVFSTECFEFIVALSYDFVSLLLFLFFYFLCLRDSLSVIAYIAFSELLVNLLDN